jgi:hypothetical protein
MRLGFLVLKKSFLKHYAGLVEYALARGIEPMLLVDQTGDECGFGGYEFPHVHELPAFRNGRASIRTYTTRDELALIVRSRRLHAVFALESRRYRPTIWFLRDACPEVLLAKLQMVPNPDTLADFTAFDVVYGLAPEWVPWATEFNVAQGEVPEADREEWAKRLEKSFVPVGFAEMEQLKYIDRATVRPRLGLPDGPPIVLYLPFPFQSTRYHGDFWPRWVYGRSRPAQWASVLLSGRTEFRPYAQHGWNDRRLVRAVRAFCDANGALLVVKTREKNPVPGYLAAVADHVFGDDMYYPATMLELAAVSDLCVHFYSTGLCEAVYAGTPNLCISPTAVEWPVYAKRMVVDALSTTPPSFYNFPGVTYSWTVPEFVTRFSSAQLTDFPLDAAARGRYLRRFLGPEDLDVAARIVSDLEPRLAVRACSTR